MASFEAVNYLIRPNKSVERKLIFDTLLHLSKTFDIPSYIYVGMGSMWFIDFVLAHRNLGISKLISFEHPDYSSRAKFNCPYKAIEVRGETVSDGIKNLNWQENSVVWLDYDTGPEGPVLEDVGYLAQRMSVGSFLLITLNAHVARLPDKDSQGNPITRHEALSELMGEFAPDDSEFPNLNLKQYPFALAKALTLCVERETRRSARGIEFYPFMNFKYSDNAPMITVGGVFLDTPTKEKFLTNTHVQTSHYLNNPLFEISIPHLTQRERAVLDSLLPDHEGISEAKFEDACGFRIPQKSLSGYSEFYKLYPVFGEILI
ncbi:MULTISPECIES: O-methyltransferase [Pseudomonas]|uniref:O-methyltransferase n=1 Tax=Pseudomonas TaxID=286 RepID=UPI0012E029B3|nr:MULTISPECIES: O-methyltransferase [Pseudomonas]